MTVKTAISIQSPLLARIDAAAKELGLSRSAFLARAAEAMVAGFENRKLLARINEAYDDAPDEEERRLQQGMRRLARRQVEGEW